MLKAGQRPKRPQDPMLIPTLGWEDPPTRYTVKAVLADRLKLGDLVRFTSDDSTTWSKTWRVAKVERHREDDTRKVYVTEVKDW